MAYTGQYKNYEKEVIESFTVYPEDPKYGTLIGIPVGTDKRAWKFGFRKAKAIVDNYKHIKDWVDSQEQKKVT